MTKHKISVLIRCKNESEWLPFLFDSLERQIFVQYKSVLILDNCSNDEPENLVALYPNLPLKFENYDLPYIPGEMLNYGIDRILGEPGTDYVLIISAHCFLRSNDSIVNLVRAISSSSQYRCAYGRQIPMSNSDSQAIRDLSLIYTKEPKTISSSASFNNAFSLVKKVAFLDHLFDAKATNLEDTIWAHHEIQRGYSIKYVPTAEAVHYHGPHHSNNSARLKNTETTIRSYQDVFNVELVEPSINLKNVAQFFFGIPSESFISSQDAILDALCFVVKSHDDRKILIGLGVDDSKVLVVKSSNECTMYSLFPQVYSYIKEIKPWILYLVIYDNSFDLQLPAITSQQAAKLLSQRFANCIWPVAESKHIPFDKDMSILEEEKFAASFTNKLIRFESRRGNGLILTRKVLMDPKLLFTSYSAFRLSYE